jgi:hypothetical protein
MAKVEIEFDSSVETKIAQYFDKNGHRCTKPENATTIIPIGTIGRITKLENMPMPNTAQVYFSEFDMYVAYFIGDLKPPRYANLKQVVQKT